MDNSIKKQLKKARLEYRNIRGKCLEHKFIVIESDDWGSIRQPSKKVYLEQVKRSGKEIVDPFFRYDSVERNEDLESLFAVLEKHTDCDGNPAIITADYAIANPCFDYLRKTHYTGYSYETIDNTYKNYEGSSDALTIALQGIERKVWKPQLHCREHVQVARWMRALQSGNQEIQWAFEHGMISTADTIEPLNHYAFMDAFNYAEKDHEQVAHIISDATTKFRKLFGYDSKTFVASCYVWNDCLERALKDNGIHSMQASWYQWIPDEEKEGGLIKKNLYMGQRSKNQRYTVRNCLFEPSLFESEDNVSSCLKQIESAFRWKKPAIISSHRVNYMSRIDEENRKKNLFLLDELLSHIEKRWPDVRFVSSDIIAEMYADEGKLLENE